MTTFTPSVSNSGSTLRDASPASAPSPVLVAARRYLAAGLSIMPIRADGSKAPDLSEWKPLQQQRATPEQVEQWFRKNVGIALIGGAVSGNLVTLDFDEAGLFPQYEETVADHGEEWAALIASLPCVLTPSEGHHLYYRCEEPPEGNQKLAMTGGKQTRIETRGEGGYAIVAPSPAACHPDKRPYVLLRGDLAHIPVITVQQRAFLHHIAIHFFNQYTPPCFVDAPASKRVPLRPDEPTQGMKPGDDYNQRGDYESLLERHGWKRLRRDGEGLQWQRPGKEGAACSGTTGYQGHRVLYVFSSNAAPFAHEKGYNAFAVYALLEHAGDFRAAARALAAEGYGTPDARRERRREQREQEQREQDARLDALQSETALFAQDMPAFAENSPEQVDKQVDNMSDESDITEKSDITPAVRDARRAPGLAELAYRTVDNLEHDLQGVGVHAERLRLVFSPNADREDVVKAFGLIKRANDKMITVFNFLKGQSYAALPTGSGIRGNIVGAFYDGPTGVITRGEMQKLSELARIIKRVPPELWDMRRLWSFYDELSYLPHDRQVHWATMKPYNGWFSDMKSEVAALRGVRPPLKQADISEGQEMSSNKSRDSIYSPTLPRDMEPVLSELMRRARSANIPVADYLSELLARDEQAVPVPTAKTEQDTAKGAVDAPPVPSAPLILPRPVAHAEHTPRFLPSVFAVPNATPLQVLIAPVPHETDAEPTPPSLPACSPATTAALEADRAVGMLVTRGLDSNLKRQEAVEPHRAGMAQMLGVPVAALDWEVAEQLLRLPTDEQRRVAWQQIQQGFEAAKVQAGKTYLLPPDEKRIVKRIVRNLLNVGTPNVAVSEPECPLELVETPQDVALTLAAFLPFVEAAKARELPDVAKIGEIELPGEQPCSDMNMRCTRYFNACKSALASGDAVVASKYLRLLGLLKGAWEGWRQRQQSPLCLTT